MYHVIFITPKRFCQACPTQLLQIPLLPLFSISTEIYLIHIKLHLLMDFNTLLPLIGMLCPFSLPLALLPAFHPLRTHLKVHIL
jgi:hypothetical protein